MPYQNAFEECQLIEKRLSKRLEPFIEEIAYKGRHVKTAKGNLAKLLQERCGDELVNITDEHIIGLEYKVERRWTGNLFIEIWSNQKRQTKGWAYKLECDFVLFYFGDKDKLVIVHWPTMWGWLNTRKPSGLLQMDPYKLVEQKEHIQPNDTWGKLVNVSEVLKNVRSCVISVRQLELFDAQREEGRNFVHISSGKV